MPKYSARILLLLSIFCGAVCAAFSQGEPPSVVKQAAEDAKFEAECELSELEAKVAMLEFPLTLADALKRVGGNEKLQWCCSIGHSYKDRYRDQMVYAIITPHLKGKGYVVVLEGDAIIDGGTSIVARAMVGFRTELGGTFYADLRDTSEVLRDARKSANQAPVPTATSVTPAADAPVAPAAAAAHL